jgi:hypothetical protein
VPAVYGDSPFSDGERRARFCAGDLFAFSPTPSSLGLSALARELSEEAFAPQDRDLDPLSAELIESVPTGLSRARRPWSGWALTP